MIFDDFHGFSQISSFLHIVLNASRKQIAPKYLHFRDFVWIRAIFGWKSMKFRRLLQSVTLTCPEAFRTWKSRFFAKCYLDVLKRWFFVDFCRVLIDDFRRFSWIFIYFMAFAHRFERFQEASRFETLSFFGFGHRKSSKFWKMDEMSILRLLNRGVYFVE